MTKYLIVGAVLLCLHGWAAVPHQVPWLAFYNEWPFGAALLLSGVAALFPPNRGEIKRISLPGVLLAPFLVALIPVVQFQVGQILFLGDALMASLYLSAFGVACVAGFRLHEIYGEYFVRALAGVLVAGSLISFFLASHQWLQLEHLGLWLVEMRPTGRPYANLAQPNNLATLFCCGVVAALYLRAARCVGNSATFMIVVTLFLGIAMTRSRTALLIGVVVVLWLVVFRGRHPFRCRVSELVGGVSALVLTWALIPLLAGALHVHAEPTVSRLESVMGGDARLAIWRQLLDAVSQRPLAGYGWNQVSVAQIQVAAEHPPTVFVEHAHNIFIDLLIWNGLPIGLVLIGALIGWVLYSSARIRSPESWFAILIVMVVGTHGTLELPLEYAYFLFFVGLCVGIVQREWPSTYLVNVSRTAAASALGAGSLALAAIFFEYQILESDSLKLQFEAAKLAPRPESPSAPDVVLLTQLREQIRFGRTEARPNMEPSELVWMKGVAHRFPTPGALYRYALALGLNDRLLDARLELTRLHKLHGAERYSQASQAIQALTAEYPRLLQLCLPSEMRHEATTLAEAGESSRGDCVAPQS